MTIKGIRGLVATAIAASLVLVWCSAPLRAAAPEGDTVLLRLATVEDSLNPTGVQPGEAAFVRALGEASGGKIDVAVTTLYDSGAAEAESELVRAIASGAVDGGWPASRAFAAAGIPGIEALDAPMTITSVAAQKALVSGPIAEHVLSELAGSGIVGLGLMVGPLRRPFATAPLLGADAWRGVRFRVLDSRVEADAIRSFGAAPVKSGLEWIDQTRASRLDGGDFDIPQFWAGGERSTLEYVTANVVLWPMMSVLSLSQKRFDALSEAQRGWVRDAARQAVLASGAANYDETEYVKVLCQRGVRFLNASTEQIAQLRHRLAPVTARLAGSGAARRLLGEIRALAARQPGPDVPRIPAQCRTL
ncbi:MAG TPA: TRAP transporter substrate-binding protein DctP, partial [Thermopolyspora sp.]